MTDLPHETEFRPSVLRDALRHHVGLLIVLTLVFGGVGAAAAALFPGARQSSAVVLVNPLYGNPFSTEGQGDQLTNLETEAQLVSTDAVGAIAARKLGTDLAPPDLARTARGVVTANTQVIKITYTASSGAVAQARAQAFAESFLEYRQARAKALVDNRIKLLQGQEKTTRDQLTAATTSLAAQAEGSAARALLTEQVRTYTAELTRLTSAIAEQSAIPIDPGQVISPAARPADRQFTLVLLFGLAGAAAGLIVGVLAAITRERIDDRVRDVGDLDRLGVPWLGTIAPQTPWSFAQTELTEDQRRMRTAMLSALSGTPAVVVVGRCDTLQLASMSIRPLAAALVRAGVSVCVVEATPHGWPGEPQATDQDSRGLADVLLYNMVVDSVLKHPVPGLAVVPRGHWTGEVSDLLGNARMRGALSTLREKYDVVLIAAPSLQSADGQVLARVADSVMLETAVFLTTNDDVLQVVDQLARGGVPVIGSVLVSAPPAKGLFRRVRTGRSRSGTSQSGTSPKGLLALRKAPRATGATTEGPALTRLREAAKASGADASATARADGAAEEPPADQDPAEGERPDREPAETKTEREVPPRPSSPAPLPRRGDESTRSDDTVALPLKAIPTTSTREKAEGVEPW